MIDHSIDYLLLYSDHEGLAALAPWRDFMLGPDADILHIIRNIGVQWGRPFLRVSDPAEAAKLLPGEFACHPTYKQELAGLVRSGVLERTTKVVKQGFYNDVPVVRFRTTNVASARKDVS